MLSVLFASLHLCWGHINSVWLKENLGQLGLSSSRGPETAHVSRGCNLEMLNQNKAKRGQVSCMAWQS